MPQLMKRSKSLQSQMMILKMMILMMTQNSLMKTPPLYLKILILLLTQILLILNIMQFTIGSITLLIWTKTRFYLLRNGIKDFLKHLDTQKLKPYSICRLLMELWDISIKMVSYNSTRYLHCIKSTCTHLFIKRLNLCSFLLI